MPKLISAIQYDKAQELWMKTNFSIRKIAKLCDLKHSTLALWINKWEDRGIPRVVDKSFIENYLKED